MKFMVLTGHIISEEGIVVDPEKIKAIMEWPYTHECEKSKVFHGFGSILLEVH